MAEKNYVCKITPEQSGQLKDLLEIRGWELSAAPYAHYKAASKADHLSVVSYESGKLVVQGKDVSEFVMYTLEPEILHTFDFVLQNPPPGSDENPAATEAITHHGGIDESGKGDFFGPLVIAGVSVTPESGEALRKLGVCDSKLIQSSAKIKKLADAIRQAAIGHYTTVTIMPETYNRLYNSIGNLNRLLAWGHARVIENLLEKDPACPRMISDKFANESLIKHALMEKGRQITLEQFVRAESDVAVAAASILARDGFLRGMEKLSKDIAGVELPRGASAKVREVAAQIVASQGAEALARCAKMHFKTASEVLNSLF